MRRCILHLGAHRTGTTLLQEFMFVRNMSAEKLGLRLIGINECRGVTGLLSGLIYDISIDPGAHRKDERHLFNTIKVDLSRGKKIVLSDENIAGTMENILNEMTLYPNISANTLRLGPSIDLFDTIYFSIRPQYNWWVSALAFLTQKGHVLPSSETMEKISSNVRTWSTVVSELASAFPEKFLVIREFDSFISNPKRQLREITGWNEVKQIKNIEKKVANKAEKGLKILKSYSSQSLGNDHANLLFSTTQKEHLEMLYSQDILNIDEIVKGRGKFIRATEGNKSS
jgi:hypothetical protein